MTYARIVYTLGAWYWAYPEDTTTWYRSTERNAE